MNGGFRSYSCHTSIIEISPFEYCEHKEEIEYDDFKLYVYSPTMIVIEKIRAICQQVDGYKEITGSSKRPRGRDFFDIYHLIETFKVDLNTIENKEHLKAVFAAKRVPLDFLDKINDDREYHKENFETSLTDTLQADTILESFDFYVDYLLNILNQIDF